MSWSESSLLSGALSRAPSVIAHSYDGGCAINNCEDLQLVVHEP
jgi:hypothetical protein